MSTKTKLGVVFLCGLLAAAAFVWMRFLEEPWLRTDSGHVLSEADGYTRWRLVERALSGESCRIRWITDDNAPRGRLNEWTSPTTIIGATFVRTLQLCRVAKDRAQALNLGALWLGPVVGLLSLILLGWLGWRIGGWALACCWLLAWPVLPDVFAITRLGNPDHHSLHQLLFICMIAGSLAWTGKPTTRGGIFLGATSAIALWSAGSELSPAWFLIAALLACEIIRPPSPETTAYWRAWWITGVAVSLVAWLYEFRSEAFHVHVEMFSAWHVSLFVLAGFVIEGCRILALAPRGRAWAMGGAFVVAVLLAAAMQGFDWTHLHVIQNVEFQREMSVTREFQPMATGWAALLREGWIRYGLLPLLIIPLLASVPRQPLRMVWLCGSLLLFLGLTCQQMRWADFLVVLIVLAAGLGSLQIKKEWPLLGVLLMLIAILPLWRLPLAVAASQRANPPDPLHGPYAETVLLDQVARCIAETDAERPVILAAWDQNPILAGTGRLRVIGSPYWSNLDGLRDNSELFTTTSAARFQELAGLHEATYLLLCGPDRMARAIAQSYQMVHGCPPTREELMATVLWRIAVEQRAYQRVPCGALETAAPDWTILRLPEVLLFDATPPPS